MAISQLSECAPAATRGSLPRGAIALIPAIVTFRGHVLRTRHVPADGRG